MKKLTVSAQAFMIGALVATAAMLSACQSATPTSAVSSNPPMVVKPTGQLPASQMQ